MNFWKVVTLIAVFALTIFGTIAGFEMLYGTHPFGGVGLLAGTWAIGLYVPTCMWIMRP